MPEETGAALLIALIALSLFSLLGLYMTLNSTAGLHISDNYESQLQATYAAQAGLNHARILLRGLDFNDLLKGPDGACDRSSSYTTQAKSYGFRNPLPLATAHSLNIVDPINDVAGIPDDGLINTGYYNGTSGTALIPITGIGLAAPNPYGDGSVITSRYFVKVTDNNGQASELAGDSLNDPFVDGDGIVIVRSMGVAQTITTTTGLIERRNSVAVFEARYKRLSTFDLGPALIVQGAGVSATFEGKFFDISGDLFPGIGTIDTNPGDTIHLEQIMQAAAIGKGNISGGGLPNPSIQDITGQVTSNPDKALVLDPSYLWNFVHNQMPGVADYYYDGNQNWSEGSAPYAGFYDISKPWNAPEQDPKVTIVNGNLQVSGNFSGGGLLIVTGDFSCSGAYAYNGLVLVIGSGNVFLSGSGQGITGGLFAASVINKGGSLYFGAPSFSIAGSARITANRNAVKMAVGLIPVSQISFREITGADP